MTPFPKPNQVILLPIPKQTATVLPDGKCQLLLNVAHLCETAQAPFAAGRRESGIIDHTSHRSYRTNVRFIVYLALLMRENSKELQIMGLVSI